jgi:hypothetical protein
MAARLPGGVELLDANRFMSANADQNGTKK